MNTNLTAISHRHPLVAISLALSLSGACEAGGAGRAGQLPGPALATSSLEDEAPVPVYMNHVYTVLPPATYAGIRDSVWLNTEFSHVEERTTVRPDLTYTGTYLLFERTYLELFPVGPAFPVETGALALSDEVAGGKDWVADNMVALFGQDHVEIGIISRTVDGKPVPWFHYAFPAGVFSAFFDTWNMEFVTKEGATNPPTRQESLASFYQPDKLARNTLAAAYALPIADGEGFRKLLEAVEWSTSGGEEGRFIAFSPVDAGVRRAVIVEPSTDTCKGITALAIAMNRNADHVEELGGARLVAGVLGKKLAVLELRPAECSSGALEGVAGGLAE